MSCVLDCRMDFTRAKAEEAAGSLCRVDRSAAKPSDCWRNPSILLLVPASSLLLGRVGGH